VRRSKGSKLRSRSFEPARKNGLAAVWLADNRESCAKQRVRDQAQSEDADQGAAYRRRRRVTENSHGVGRLTPETDCRRDRKSADRQIDQSLRDETGSGQPVGPRLRPRYQSAE
jgi:hypothetical protein